MNSSDWNPQNESDAASLTPSQVKALLLVALRSREEVAALQKDLASAEQLLMEMNPALGISTPAVLEQAAQGTTPVPELIRLKELAKMLIRDAANADQREAARLLYHVSVASAFVFHDARISNRAMRKQHDLYEQFAERWDGHPIGRLFRRAADYVAGDDRTTE